MCGVIVRPVGGRHSHAEACVYTIVYVRIRDTVVYVRSVPSFVLRISQA